MKKSDLQKLTTEDLKKKEKASKKMIGFFIPVILLLFFFPILAYFKGEELDMAIITIAICSVGGMVSVIPGLRLIQEELKERD